MDKTINYLKNIISENCKIVIGVSGGPDSMCLLHLLCDLKKTINFDIIVAHMNHKVRKESEEEKYYVENFCKSNNLIFEYFELKNIPKSNFHSEARIIRYDFFNRLIKKHKANYLMTAHHSDDLIETILMRIERGSNLKGYSGFELETKKDNYIQVKPLIFYTKKDIIKYMDKNNYKYYIDRTNNDDDYLRNRYRHHILPELYKEYDKINDKYYKYSLVLLEADNFINNYVNKIINNIYQDNTLDIKLFLKEDKYIQRKILEYILSTLYIKDLYKVSDSNINEIFKMVNSNTKNITLKLPNNNILTKEYDKVYVNKTKVINKIIKNSNNYYEDNNYLIKEVKDSDDTSNYTIRLNTKELCLPLKFRYKESKDKIMVKNSKFYSKVKDIFIDKKIPLNMRNNIPILVDDNNEILWIVGIKKSKFDKNAQDIYDLVLTCEKK